MPQLKRGAPPGAPAHDSAFYKTERVRLGISSLTCGLFSETSYREMRSWRSGGVPSARPLSPRDSRLETRKRQVTLPKWPTAAARVPVKRRANHIVIAVIWSKETGGAEAEITLERSAGSAKGKPRFVRQSPDRSVKQEKRTNAKRFTNVVKNTRIGSSTGPTSR